MKPDEEFIKSCVQNMLYGKPTELSLPGGSCLFIVPLDGGRIMVAFEGKGCVVLDDPSHVNKFLFVSAGFSIIVAEVANELVRRIAEATLNPEPEKGLLTIEGE